MQYHWDDVADAPAFARWKFHLHFGCIRSERWPTAFGHGVGFVVSPGTTVRVWFWNDGMVERYIPPTTPMPDLDNIDYLDACGQYLPGGSVTILNFICIDFIFH